MRRSPKREHPSRNSATYSTEIMALPQFFLENQVLAEEEAAVFALRLTKDDVQHARVLRLREDEHIAVIDAVQDYFECVIISFDQDTVLVQIASRFEEDKQRPTVVLVQGLAKGEKMDMIIRHATELGVQAFVPFAAARSVVKLADKKAEDKVRRWQAIAKSAAMQSGQHAIPEVSSVLSLQEVCEFVAGASVVVICWEEERTETIHSLVGAVLARLRIAPEDARVAVIVGPEGGLTETEVDALRAANSRAGTVSLGSSILRTETAGIVAPALVFYDLEHLQ